MTFQELRKTKYRTAKELAEMLKMPTPRVQKWESGDSAPRLVDLRKVAKTLDVTVEQLLDCFKK